MAAIDSVIQPAEIETRDAPSRIKIPRRDLLSFCTGLSALQRAGIPLLQALHGIQESTSSAAMREVLDDVVSSIEEGVSFSRALSSHPRVFDPFFVNMVGVGEATGKLDFVLERLSENIEREEDLNSQIRGAAAYPVFTLVITMSIIGFILIVVVPRFMDTFTKSGIPMPLPTRIVLDLSNTVKENIVLILGALLLSPMLFSALRDVPSIRSGLDSLKLRLPLVGPLHHKVVLIRFSRSLQLLTESGVGLLSALELVKGVVGNTIFSDSIDDLSEYLQDGGKIGTFVKDHRLFPEMTYQLIGAGESSGRLTQMLGEICRFYEKETQRHLKIIISLMEPAMIFMLGVIVGGIVIALFLPMFSMVQGFAR